MTINSYFKTAEEINQLFQKAYEALQQHGYAATAKLFEEAFRHDPYRLQAHYTLALHFAAIKHATYFQAHFFVCWNIDAAYKEKILTDTIVVNAFDNETIAKIVAEKELKSLWDRRSFKAIDPDEYNGRLIIKPDQKKAIAAVYASLDDAVTQYWDMHKINNEPPDLFEEYLQPDFENIDYFCLEHSSLLDGVNCPPEALYTALHRISEYIANNVRFWVFSEDNDFVDEMIILNGVLHLYRHQTGTDFYYGQLEYFETLVNRYPEDHMLRSWLCYQYQQAVLTWIGCGLPEEETKNLEKAMRLSTPEDPWMPLIQGKVALQKGEKETALKYFKEAAAKTSGIFEISHELGILQVQYSHEYIESLGHLSAALQQKPYTDIYAWRALAFLKLNRINEAEADINSYIEKTKPHNNDSFIFAGRLLSEAGFKAWGNRLFHGGLEKNKLHEDELIEKREQDTDPDKSFHDSQLRSNAKTRALLYNGLGINAGSPQEQYDYAAKALSLHETNPQLLFNMGVVLNEQGKMAAAEQYYDRALELDGNLITALNNKSIIRMQQKDHATALQLTDQILQIDNAYAEAFSTKAIIAYTTGDLPAALKYYEEYLTRNPVSGKGQYGVGFIYTHMREDEKAIPYLLQAIELSTNNAQLNEMYSNLANCYNNTGQLPASIEAAEKSIAVNPNYYHPYYILACIYKKQERDDEALEMVKKALQLAPSQRNQIINEPDLVELKEKMKLL